MGVILAKFRKEKSTQEVLEALQEKIEALETFTVNTQEQKKRIVGNFLAVSIGVYVIAFAAFYFVYFPPTWKERFVYFMPLLLFPIIIILLRYLFTWYFQRKLNKNSKKLTALKAEKKKILEQVMDKETYKVAVNLLARFADKPSKTSVVLSTATPNKLNRTTFNRSLPMSNLNPRSQQLSSVLTPSPATSSQYLSSNSTSMTPQMSSLSPYMPYQSNNNENQQLRRRTPFPIVNQQNKGVFDRIVDVLIGDGPQDRFAMICKECYSHNGMALKEDFEFTTFRCAFCNVLNPARKARPVAPRLSVNATSTTLTAGSDTSDSDDDKNDDSEEESLMNSNTKTKTEFLAATNGSKKSANSESDDTASRSSDIDEYKADERIQPPSDDLNAQSGENSKGRMTSSLDKLLKQLEESEAAIDDTTVSPE